MKKYNFVDDGRGWKRRDTRKESPQGGRLSHRRREKGHGIQFRESELWRRGKAKMRRGL